MSIASEISRLQTAKTDIKTAIEAKGVTVPSSATIDTYDDYVAEISGGGSSADTEALKGVIQRDITSIDIPSGTTSIGDYALFECRSLSSVTIPNSVTSINNSAFASCSNLTSITIPSGVTTIGGNAFANCSGLSGNVTIPDSVTSIGFFAFSNCSGLTSVTIPNSVTSIGNSAFQNCVSLSSVNIPTGVTTIGWGVFWGCTSLSNVTIPDSVTTIGEYAFIDCRSLSSVTIPDSVTSIGINAFRECSGLSSVTVEATTPPALGSWAFNDTNDCPIYVPCSSVSAYRSASGWSDYASMIQGIPPCEEPTKWVATFTGGTTVSAECDSSSAITKYEVHSGIASIQIGDCVTSIGYGAFDECSSLSSVTIPNSVTSISNEAFYGCTSLSSITLPDSVTSIGPSAFQSCTSLTSVKIGNGVTSIEGYAFYGCRSLTSITVEATTPPALGSWAFNDTNNCPIYVPAASVNAYKSASGWSDYASRIQAIPTPTHQWVSYNEGDTVPSTTFYGVKLYTGLGADNEIDFGDIDTYSAAFTYNTSNNEWTAIDIASYDPIDISGYFDGNNCYTILFSDIGCGGMPVSWPMTGEQFEFNVDLYEEI